MFAELWFVYGLLFFIGVVLFMRAGRFVATHILQKKSLLRRKAGRFERRHPALFDGGDTFYSFFHRDLFHMS